MQISLLIFYTSRKDQGKVIMSSPRTSKNWTNKFNLCLRSFFGRNQRHQKHFEINWPLYHYKQPNNI
jgi:hypothetical protein